MPFCRTFEKICRRIATGGVTPLDEEKLGGPVNTESTSNVNTVSRPDASKQRSGITKGEFVMVNVQRKNLGTVSLLNLDGKLVIGETDPLREVVQTLPSTTSVTLDLSHVTLVDAHGLGVLLHMREQAEARDMRFELMNVGHHLREVFRMTHLDSVFQMRAGVEFLRPASINERTSVAA